MHRFARDRYKHAGIRFVLGTVEVLDLQRIEPFDVIVCADADRHLSDCHNALDSVRRLLRPGGCYLQTSPPVAARSVGEIPDGGAALPRNRLDCRETIFRRARALTEWFTEQKYFWQIPLRERHEIASQFHFHFEPLDPADPIREDAIASLILCRVPSPARPGSLSGVNQRRFSQIVG